MATTQFTRYQLPDGRIVRVDATAAKDASMIDYTLAGGLITQAVRVASLRDGVVDAARERLLDEGYIRYPRHVLAATIRTIRRSLRSVR